MVFDLFLPLFLPPNRMIMPPGRNAIDASPGMPWAGGKHPETGTIEP